MTNDSQGQIGWEIWLLDSASKGKSGRRIPLNEEVRKALIKYRDEVLSKARPNDMSPAGPLVIKTERSQSTSAQAIVKYVPTLVPAPSRDLRRRSSCRCDWSGIWKEVGSDILLFSCLANFLKIPSFFYPECANHAMMMSAAQSD
jgi:hypothetical protein